MTDQVTNHGEAGRLGHALHRAADIAQVVAGPGHLDARLEGLLRHAQEDLGNGVHVADGVGARRIGIPPFQKDARVDADDVALLHDPLPVRDAVHHLMVYGDAEAGREPVQPLE